MKILFVQLPLLDHGGGYISGNVEYAPAQLCAYIKKNYPTTDPQMLPALYSLFASNDKICNYIERLEPDILCFTMYLWNAERQLKLAHRIRQLLPDTLIVCGGPEVSTGSFLFEKKYEYIDFFFHGEGEWFFEKLFNGEIDPGIIEQPSDQLIDTGDIVEPFTHNWLNVLNDRTLHLELTRGCPYRCTYCYYSKNCSSVREHSHQLLIDALSQSQRFDEIYIMSPTLNSSENFKNTLKEIIKMNKGVRLHSEVRPELIDKETAKIMYDAGFRSLEVGLQTMTSSVRKVVNRKIDPMKEIEGMEHLHEAGIDLKIGVIPGLPGETRESFLRTTDVLFEKGFGHMIELYPLMVLPGTEIRINAERERIDFQQKPPYFYKEGWGMSVEDIKNISLELERETGLSFATFTLPDFSLNTSGMICNGLHVKKSGDIDYNDMVKSFDSSVMSIFIDNTKNIYSLMMKAEVLQAHAELLKLVIIGGSIVNENKLLSPILDNVSDSLYRRMSLFQIDEDINPWQIFHVVGNPEEYDRALEVYKHIIPILDLKIEMFPYLHGDEALLVRKEIYKDVKEELIRLYSENEEDVTFDSEESRKDFYSTLGIEYIEYPFSFFTRII